MRTEKEIRKEIKDKENAIKIGQMLFERTGQEQFEQMSIEHEIVMNALKWVLKEFEPEQNVIHVANEDIN